MTDTFTLLKDFRAVHGWRYRYVKRTWFVFDGEKWTHLDALPQMQQALIGLARDIFPAKHKAPVQLGNAYMIRAMEMRLREHLSTEELHRDPFQNRVDSGDPDLQ